MSPEQLRDAAWALDMLTKLTKVLLEPIAAMKSMNAATAEVTVELTRDDEPMTSADARTILDWLASDDMQSELRAFADEIEAS